jgi:hypothetical protein
MSYFDGDNMRVIYEKSIEYQVAKKLENPSERVILRRDLEGFGSYRQLSRVLNKFIQQKKLVKISFGVYAKAYPSQYIDEPLIIEGFDTVCREALNKLQVKWELGGAEQAYNQGKTQQVPTQNIIRLKSRCRRKIAYATRQLYFEGDINAR